VDVRTLDYAARALAGAVCCVALAACNHDSPSDPRGAPPGQNVPGAPGGGGGGGGKRVPVGPYKIPPVVIQAGTAYPDLGAWHELEQGFWDACPGGSHCVTPVFALVDSLDTVYHGCEMVDLWVGGVKITEVGTPVPMGSRIVVNIKRPCPGLEGDGTGGSPPVGSPAESPDASDQPYTP
jgi:hypothetical protein